MTFDVSVQHYDHHYLLTDGDQFRGGSGISGILTPLSRAAFRKSKRQQAVDDPFDTMLLGHFHQYMTIPGILVNGCFPSDSKVMTSNGYADIQHVPEGELVMSRDLTSKQGHQYVPSSCRGTRPIRAVPSECKETIGENHGCEGG